MAGNHRAPGPPKRTPSVRSVVVAVVAVVAVIGGVYALNRPSDDPNGSQRAPTPTPTLTPSSLPTVEVTPTPSPTPTPTAPVKTASLPRVAASTPKRFEIRGLIDVGFDSAVAPRNGVFSAGSTAEVARWGGRGVPGSPGSDTVFVIGKVVPGGAFSALTEVRRGTTVRLRTGTGVLTYTVQTVAAKPAAGLTKDPAFTRRVSGRLQLVGIRYTSGGDRTGTILVVTAQLTGARRSG